MIGQSSPNTSPQNEQEARKKGMGALEAMMTRRSIRKFTEQPVPNDLLDKIIECGLRAPSTKNSQPWKLHVVSQKEMLRRVSDLLINNPDTAQSGPIDPHTGKPNEKFKPTVPESAQVLQSAPVAIFIENLSPIMGGRKEVIHSPHVDTAIHGLQFEVMSIGAAVQNMLLASHAQGLGGVFMGDVVLEEANIKDILGISGDLVGAIALGYPDQKDLWEKPLEENRVVIH